MPLECAGHVALVREPRVVSDLGQRRLGPELPADEINPEVSNILPDALAEVFPKLVCEMHRMDIDGLGQCDGT